MILSFVVFATLLLAALVEKNVSENSSLKSITIIMAMAFKRLTFNMLFFLNQPHQTLCWLEHTVAELEQVHRHSTE